MANRDLFNEWFKYDNGALFWRKKNKKSSKTEVGSFAGFLHKSGYYCITLLSVQYRRSRIVWTMHNGDIPDTHVLDHIDRNKQNDLIANLRVVSYSENSRNTDVYENATSNFHGVSRYMDTVLWNSTIKHNGRTHALGYYVDEVDAARAVNIFARDNGLDIFNNVKEPFNAPTRHEREDKNKFGQKGVSYNSRKGVYEVTLYNPKLYCGSFKELKDAIEMAQYQINKRV